MQVPPIPQPVNPVASPDAAVKAAAQVQAQAAKPLLQRAVDPASKSEQGNRSRSNSDKSKGERSQENDRGGSVNIRV